MRTELIVKTARERSQNAIGVHLQVGDIVDLGKEGHHLVWMVNDCRAACIPLSKAVDTEGGDVDYIARDKSISISPNSEAPIVRRLGRTGMIEFLENQKQRNNTSMKTKEKTAETETTETPRLGKLGGFLGHPITAVIRAMAKAGWKYWECRNVFDKEKIPVADNTIRIQLGHGRAGRGGEAAPVAKKELEALRPDPSEKPARATNDEGDEKPAKKKGGKDKSNGNGEEKASKKDKGGKDKGKAKAKARVEEEEPDFEDGQ